MDMLDQIQKTRQALKLSNDVEDTRKLEGLGMLGAILSHRNSALEKYGYIDVVFNELIRLLKFESGHIFRNIADLLINFYSKIEKYQDDLMESFIHRYGLSNDGDISLECLRRITTLVDCMNDNIAKHSKKLLELSDLHSTVVMKPKIIEILQKLRTKLPTRIDIDKLA